MEANTNSREIYYKSALNAVLKTLSFFFFPQIFSFSAFFNSAKPDALCLYLILNSLCKELKYYVNFSK